jgi:simple sugar transport system ATP-binding protein
MENVSKNFGAVRALQDVNIDVNANEVVGLVGDNGAGKSTLIKALTGVYPLDSGSIYHRGRLLKIRSPKDARDLGIETLYQDLALIPLLSVSRNFYLGRELVHRIGPMKFNKKREMDSNVSRALMDIGIRMRSPDEEVEILSGGERQSVAIARAIHFGAKLLILDEPTAALSIKESQRVLEYVLEARERGLAIVFITHNIYHVYSVATRFVVMEHGKKVFECRKDEITPEAIIEIVKSGYSVS